MGAHLPQATLQPPLPTQSPVQVPGSSFWLLAQSKPGKLLFFVLCWRTGESITVFCGYSDKDGDNSDEDDDGDGDNNSR